jgi:phosphatidylglycerol:prolipoprotein diacylglycerol transferase
VFPILFQIPEWVPVLGGLPITSFGVMMLFAFLAAGLTHRAEMKRIGRDPDISWDLLFWAVVGGLLGAKVYYMLLNFPRLVEDPWGLIVSRAGLVWYGGFIGGAILVLWQIRKHKLHIPTQADITAPGLALAYGVGRIGCFLVGDDWGRPTGSWVGVRFPEGAPPTRVDIIEREFGIQVDPELVSRFGEIVPVHPTQLYEVGLSLVIFAFLWSVRKHPRKRGWLFMVWLALAGAERLLVEFFRAKDDRFFGPLTLAQLISMVLILVGVVGILRLRETRAPAEGRPTSD